MVYEQKLRSAYDLHHVAYFDLRAAHGLSAQAIVVEAQRTGHGIALEDLSGIRERARLRKPQRTQLHSWAFAQLGAYVAYKAEAAGVALVYVDPAYTSQTCSEPSCGYRDRLNRNRQKFVCRSCGAVAHADHNASTNIAVLGAATWTQGAVNRPDATASTDAA